MSAPVRPRVYPVSMEVTAPELWITAEMLRAVAIWSTAARKREEEACGVMLGTGTVVSGVRRLTNAVTDPQLRRKRYQFDPAEQQGAWALAEKGGVEVLGIWHSHPYSQANMSDHDKFYAMPWLYYLVYGMADFSACRSGFEIWKVDLLSEDPVKNVARAVNWAVSLR